MAGFVASAYKSLNTMLGANQASSASIPPLQQATAAAAIATLDQAGPALSSPPPDAKPAKPASAAPAVVSSAAQDRVEVWGRGDKFARGAYVEDRQLRADSGELVPVKAHLRPTPGSKPAEKTPITAEAIVKEYGRNERHTTHRALFVGGLVHSWLLRQPERPADEQLDRSSALKVLRRKLLEAKYDRRSCRIDRDLRCYHAARLLGGEAESLSISAIREVLPLIERHKESQRWQLLPAYAEVTKLLWARMLAEKLSGDVVRVEVRKILPARSLPMRRKKVRLAAILRAVPALKREELLALTRRCEEELAKGSQPAAA
ncbi:MAG: hypothetical protein ACLP9L_41625 [Thermoguttaceae bacterium]